MRIKRIVSIHFTDKEYDSLFEAQQIWQKIADLFDEEGVLDDCLEEMFDSMDKNFSDLLDIVDSGIEQEEIEEGDHIADLQGR